MYDGLYFLPFFLYILLKIRAQEPTMTKNETTKFKIYFSPMWGWTVYDKETRVAHSGLSSEDEAKKFAEDLEIRNLRLPFFS